jgi:hypothetical protein
VVRARRSGSHESLRNITPTLGDYLSIQQYDDPDLRLGEVILKNFERGTLYNVDSVEKIARIMTVSGFWDQVERHCGAPVANLRCHISELITRHNQIAHRAHRPDEGEEADMHDFRPILFAWTNIWIQAAKTLVTAIAGIIEETLRQLEAEIAARREQAEMRRLAGTS